MKSGSFSRLWKAGLISSTGDWVAILATLSLAESLAGGGGIVLALTSRVVPGLFFAAIGGVVADRLPRKQVLLTCEISRAALAVSLAFVQTIGALVLVNLLLEAFTLVFQPAKEASVPTLVQRNELVRANSLSLSAAYGTFPLGAAIFLAIAPLGDNVTLWGWLPGTQEGLAFLVDACSYLASAAFILTLPALAYHRRERDPLKRRNPMAPLHDVWDGIVFVATQRRVRAVVLSMMVALAGGGIIVVLGKPFAKDVLNAGTVGFPALLTAFGMGAGMGIVVVTIFGPRIQHKDVFFSIALLVCGGGLAAAAFIRTIFGGVGWVFVMGYGAGSAYVLGFAHLHEHVEDQLRGRTFAALFTVMRMGLLTAMMVALPAAQVLQGRLPGLLATGSRVVLLGGGVLMLAAGMLALWSTRRSLIELGHAAGRPEVVAAAAEAFRKHTKTIAGLEETAEVEAANDEGTLK